MSATDFIGVMTIIIFTFWLLIKIFRLIVPKRYNWNNCPNDHDTMARYGYSGRCIKCGNKL
jgi:hypothetical protein